MAFALELWRLIPVRGGVGAPLEPAVKGPIWPPLDAWASLDPDGALESMVLVSKIRTLIPSTDFSRELLPGREAALRRARDPLDGDGSRSLDFSARLASVRSRMVARRAVAGSSASLTEGVRRPWLPEALALPNCRFLGPEMGVPISAASCLMRAMSLLDGIRFRLAYPPGVAVRAEDVALTDVSLKRQSAGDIAEVRIGVTPMANGVGSSPPDCIGAPFSPKLVISFRGAFFALRRPDAVRDGGDSCGL